MDNKYIFSTKRVSSVDEYISAVKEGYLFITFLDGIGKELLEKLREIKDTSDVFLYMYANVLFYMDENEYISEEYYRIATSLVERNPYLGEELLGECYSSGLQVKKDEKEAFNHYLISAKYGNAFAQNCVAIYLKNNAEDEDTLKEAITWFESAAKQDLAYAQYNLGDCYYYGNGVKENNSQAFNLYLKAAKQGISGAMNMVGVCYENGFGVEEEPTNAFEWYKKSAEEGYSEGMNNLARCYERGYGVEENTANAFEWYKKSAEKNNANAMRNLGDCYRFASGTAKDEKEAFYWYNKSAEQDNKFGQDSLGLCYELGIGTKIDTELAFQYYQKAAKQDYWVAQRHLGVCYENGIGTQEDPELAVAWYIKAAENGDEIAMDYLGTCYEIGTGVEENATEAFKWYKKSAEAGYSEGLNDLGRCYKNGYGTEQKPDLAIEYYQKAVDAGSYAAMNNLGWCYENAFGTKEDPRQAFRLYKKAAENDIGWAQFNLGRCYESGYGTVKINPAMAFHWYEKAAKQDIDAAIRAIGWCYENGFGVKEKHELAYKYYKESAELGSLTAINDLGRCYEDGIGTQIDHKKAFEQYLKGAEEDDSYCQYNLARCYLFAIGTDENDNKAFEYFLKSAQNDYPLAQYQLAACYEDGVGIAYNPHKAFYWYNEAVKNGETSAENSLARCYDYGIGVEKDPKKAFYWYEQSSNHGDDNGTVNLGVCYELGIGTEIDRPMAMSLYEKAANNGNEVGQCNLAWCYEDDKDYEKAIYWYEKAAEKEYSRAYLNLSIIYYYGNGVTQDYDKCFELASKAAELGNATAINNLGYYYENECGCKQDYEKAMECYLRAANLKEGIACNNLGECYYNGIVIDKDLKKAFYWYQKGAELGYPLSFYNVGYCFENGEGTNKNEKLAFRWYLKGAEEYDEMNCQYMVASYYHDGIVVKEDLDKSFEWNYKAAEQGHAMAENNVGYFYQMGLGSTPKDYEKAIYWLEKSAEQELDEPCKSLYEIYSDDSSGFYNLKKALYWLKKYEEYGGSCNEEITKLEQRIEEEKNKGIIVDQNIDIFISWNHNNLLIKEKVKKCLEDNNIKVWESDSKASGLLDKNVSFAISKAKGYIILLSKEALLSTYIPKEIEMMFARIKDEKLSSNMIKIITLDENINSEINKLPEGHIYKKLLKYAYEFSFNEDNVVSFAKDRIVEYVVLNYQIKLKNKFNVFSYSLSDETIYTKNNFAISSSINFEDGFINRSLLDSEGSEINYDEVINSKKQILIYGEGGSGKSLYVKNLIRRNKDPKILFFYIRCVDIPNSLIEDENLNLYKLLSEMCFKINEYDSLPNDIVKRVLEGEERKIIIFDAINENENNKNVIIKLIANFELLNAKTHIHFIYTSRDKIDADLISRSIEKEVEPLEIKALQDSDVLKIFDAIYKKNENKIIEVESEKSSVSNNFSFDKTKDINSVISTVSTVSKGKGAASFKTSTTATTSFDDKVKGSGATTMISSSSGISRELFAKNLVYLVDDIKKNPLLISNLIYIYFATRNLPQQRYEVLEKSNKVMINSSISTQKELLADTSFKDINALLETISFRLAINYQKQLDMVKVIKSIIASDEKFKPSAASESGKELLIEAKAQLIYDYLRQRHIVIGNKIAHDIYADFFTANYIFKQIYNTEAFSPTGKMYLGFLRNGQQLLNEFMYEGECLGCNYNPWVEVTMDFIAKLDYETKKLMPEYHERYLSYPTFNTSLERLFDENGISDNAYKILLELIEKDIDDKVITLFNYAEIIREFMKR